jgi:hypothetical protein
MSCGWGHKIKQQMLAGGIHLTQLNFEAEKGPFARAILQTIFAPRFEAFLDLSTQIKL